MKPRRRRPSRSRPNGPPAGEPWAWLSLTMLDSPAWRGLSRAAVLALTRIVIEHLRHAGKANGALVVTFLDFERAGVPRASVGAAIDEMEAFGFADVARGRGGNAEWRRPSSYRLTWLPTAKGEPANNRWRAIDSAEADAIRRRLLDQRKRGRVSGTDRDIAAGVAA